MPTHKVGGEVDAFCTRCKMTLAHTILAMVGQTIARVQCNTCGGQHAFRSAPGSSTSRSRSSSSSSGSTATRAASREPAVKTVIGFEDQLKGKDLTRARKYSVKDTYAVDEVIDHPTFGFGLVKAVRADKVDVAFKASERTLVHGRGGGAPAHPQFSQPQAKISGVADKPLPAQPGEGAEADSPDEAGEGDPADLDAEAEPGSEAESESEG
ncbi:MAG TPA: hypothetical protein VFB81_05275 [Myxococcales bacterium]|nr:hypothetical protein [Myxococcales bacterium]